MNIVKHRKYIFFALLFTAESILAQSNSTDSTFRSIESLFESGSYVSVELEGRRLLERPDISDSSRVIAEKWIAFSLIAQGKSSLAEEHFSVLLRLNPQCELDPVLTSPKILEVFNEVKARQRSSERPVNDTMHIDASRHPAPVSYRTILFPGWEQLHTGRTTAGYIFLGGGIGTLGGGIILEALRNSARREYLSATDPTIIESKYSRYNKFYRAELYMFSAFTLVYIASEVDVFGNASSSSLSFEPGFSGRPGSLSLRLKF